MKAVLCVALQVVLCMGAMAFVDLDGCHRGPVEVGTAKGYPKIREEIKQHLNLTLGENDIIAKFFVISKDLNTLADVFFAGKEKNGKAPAVSFLYGSADGVQSKHCFPIPFSTYYQYLGCEVAEAAKEDEEDTDGQK